MYPTSFPGIIVSGVYIHEPGSLLTDLLIAILCLVLYFRIGKPSNSFEKYWRLFIAMIGIGALGGVLVHGIPTVLGPRIYSLVWNLKNIFIPIGNVFALYIMLVEMFPQKRHIIEWGLWTKAGAACAAMIVMHSFTPIIIDLGCTYILVIGISNRLKKRSSAYRMIQYAFLIAFFSGFLFLFKVGIDKLWFSHNDVIHIFVILSIYLIYRAILKNRQEVAHLEEHPEKAKTFARVTH